jgi:hypothetical protein
MPRPPTPLRRRLRLARKLCDLYARRADVEVPPSLPLGNWSRLVDQARRLQEVRRRGWSEKHAAIGLVRSSLALQREIEAYADRLQRFAMRPASPTLRDLDQELAALEEEFEEAVYDPGARVVSVATESIELEEVDLGRFRIVLVCEQVEEPDYRIEALDPREPGSSDFANVTHPHVRDEELCEGAGRNAIREAFAFGRLFDFFTLVRQVLRTYNPDSAYARLDEWDGVPCSDCGYRASDERSLSCSRCDDSICLDCSRSCSECGSDLCSACSDSCNACGERYCSDCLSSNDGLCDDCLESQENDDEEPDDESEGAGEPAPPADAPLQPLCLGEADLPA